MIGCSGLPPVQYDDCQSWPIYGATVEFATYLFLTNQLVVIYVDTSYTIVEGVPLFNVPQNNEAYILGLVASNPTHC